MTRDDFEKEAQDIKELMLCFYQIRDKTERRKIRKTILYYVTKLLKV